MVEMERGMRVAEVEVAAWQHGGAPGVAWRLRRSALAVAALVLLIYGAWIAAYLLHGGNARDFTTTSPVFLLKSHASPVIRYDPTYNYRVAGNMNGYDGQFAYFLALDPVNAHFYMDVPAYRYERILYPMVARLLALGQPGLVPYTLILVNLLAVVGGTWALAAWLRRKGVSPWLALLFGLSPGVCFALQRDLNEPLGYAFVAFAVYLYDFGGRRRLLWAGLAFGLAALARESTLVFPVVYGLALLSARSSEAPVREAIGQTMASVGEVTCRGLKPGRGGDVRLGHMLAEAQQRVSAHWRPAALLLGLAVGPFVLYKLFLLLWLGSTGVPAVLTPVLVPFAGILAHQPWGAEQDIIVATDILPALICTALGTWAIQRRLGDVAIWALLVNVVLFVVLLNALSYVIDGTVRITLGVTLAALLCVPKFDRLTRHNRGWLVLCGALWLGLLPFWLVTPLLWRS
jgi:hypothetical protein